MTKLVHVAIAAALSAHAAQAQSRPDGLYANIYTVKGLITARLEADLTPLAVANFVGLAEGTIVNAAFPPGRPFYDGTTYHRVVPGHVIQTGIAASPNNNSGGYMYPNEINARLSHNHAGALQMANSGPNTNGSQFCITLGDRSYLDGDYIVFGEVVSGMNVVMTIVQGDKVDSVRIARVGSKAQAYRVTDDSFQAMARSAKARIDDHLVKKRAAEADWISRTYPHALGPAGSVLTQQLSKGTGTVPTGARRVRYTGKRVRYLAFELDYAGPPLEVTAFASGTSGVPGFGDRPQAFTLAAGAKINPGLDSVIALMTPGERRVVVVPAPMGYGARGLYPPEVPGRRRFVISPNTLLVYEVEVLAN